MLISAALGGCGALGGSSAGSSDERGACASPGVTDDTIRIGLIYPDSGSGESGFRATLSAVEARIEAANAEGGVHGREVVIDWRDDQDSPDVFSLAARDLLDDSDGQGVFALVAQTLVLSSDTFEWLEQAKIPVVGVATSEEWSDHANVFHFGNSFNKSHPTTTYGRFVKAQHATKVFLLVTEQAGAADSLAMQLTPSLQSQGIQVVGRLGIVQDITSDTKVVDTIRRSGADAVIGALQIDTFQQIYPLLAPLRLKLALNATGYSADLLASAGRGLAGATFIVPYSAFGSAAMATYLRNVDTYAPELTNPEDVLAVAGYVAADEMLTGLTLAGECPTREQFIQKLREVEDFTAGGLIPPKDLSNPRDPAKCLNFVQVNEAGNQWQPIGDPTSPSGFWCGEIIQTGAG
ncbi:ABC transporter substrate-binding protein [Frankia sp. CNm7]|uniref:ABC transporter substrate-binding protein n=1 Tax=Frankia nepalensis TaxID=1836974 RepID=A0A937RLV3_9ACTN|nr:ABC transporter substrate-binding protein [Frankia nepalensis]MBL7500999.1 ABC transporter substrate-binding protein [Frankia nepalensis]MBL7512455.1 ABC transporter substrate-binding protein [Frankia nepalensis]MBL7521520.1 ABC transporter substrate-binding protein [Frankia nepalensis]MBL7632757.1 ABC transporter substrate-binding protein [Frankia nepalensis]